MSKNKKRLAVVLGIIMLYLGTVLFLYLNYNRSPEVIMVYRQHVIAPYEDDGYSNPQ